MYILHLWFMYIYIYIYIYCALILWLYNGCVYPPYKWNCTSSHFEDTLYPHD